MNIDLSNGPLVYVACSYDTGDKGANLQRAFTAAENVVKKGGFPIVPHMCHLWHSKYYYHKRDFWIKYTMRLLYLCTGQYMIICPGSEFSPGVANERKEASLLNIVVYNYDDFLLLERFEPRLSLLQEETDGQLDNVTSQPEGDDVRSAGEQTLPTDVDNKAASNSASI